MKIAIAVDLFPPNNFNLSPCVQSHSFLLQMSAWRYKPCFEYKIRFMNWSMNIYSKIYINNNTVAIYYHHINELK